MAGRPVPAALWQVVAGSSSLIFFFLETLVPSSASPSGMAAARLLTFLNEFCCV